MIRAARATPGALAPVDGLTELTGGWAARRIATWGLLSNAGTCSAARLPEAVCALAWRAAEPLRPRWLQARWAWSSPTGAACSRQKSCWRRWARCSPQGRKRQHPQLQRDAWVVAL